MAFFELSQNNSGGSFEVNDKVTHRLIIEADTAQIATEKAVELGVYFDGVWLGRDCDCCGDRWYGDPYEVDLKKCGISYGVEFKGIEEYAQLLDNRYGQCTPDVRVFYQNGVVVEIFKQDL